MNQLKLIYKKIPLEVKYTLCLFCCTRIILTIIGCLSHLILQPKLSPLKYKLNYSQYLWLEIWGVWDTRWYVDISTNWYSVPSSNSGVIKEANYAFFPLYPLLMKILGGLIGDNYIAGIIISNIFLIIACFFLYKLVCLKSDQDTGLRAIKYLFLFPIAFILSGVFTEALFLALVIICFYYAEKGNWPIVGIFGFFLSLTRVNSVLVIIPLLWEYFKSKKFTFKYIKLDILFLLFIPSGVLIFAAYNYYLTGNFLAFIQIQSAWHRNLSNPLQILLNGLLNFKSPYYNYFSAYFTLLFQLILTIFFRKIRFSYWIYGICTILVPLSTGLLSMPRFILPIFPIYIIFAKLSKNKHIDQLLTLSLALFQGFLMVFWTMEFYLII